jgi:hypothetical protein
MRRRPEPIGPDAQVTQPWPAQSGRNPGVTIRFILTIVPVRSAFVWLLSAY